jgi:hypothetical protein
MRTRYEILDGDKWIRVTRAVEMRRGWLSYELREGRTLSTGIARPKRWRIVEGTERRGFGGER